MSKSQSPSPNNAASPSQYQKLKLLKLAMLLWQESDEQHALSTMDIVNRLGDLGIHCERRTVPKDLEVLVGCGFRVCKRWNARHLDYYIEKKTFDSDELRVIIRAIRSANFITDDQIQELINKVAGINGIHAEAELLNPEDILHDSSKLDNNISVLNTAIELQQKIIFRRFDIDSEGFRFYEYDGKHAIGDPVALVPTESSPYIVLYDVKHNGTKAIRIDRIADIEIIDEDVTNRALELRSQYNRYIELTNAGNEVRTLLLYFDTGLLDAVHEKFGENITMLTNDGKVVVVAAKVALSPAFWGWLFGYAGRVRIVFPEDVIGLVTEQSNKVPT